MSACYCSSDWNNEPVTSCLCRKRPCGVPGAALQGPVQAGAPEAVRLQAASVPGDLLPSSGPAGPGTRGLRARGAGVARRQLRPAAAPHQERFRPQGPGSRRHRGRPQQRPHQDGACPVAQLLVFSLSVKEARLVKSCLWLVQKSHLALIDSLMSLAAEETVGRVKMAVEAGQMGVGAPWENALLFWVNRVRLTFCPSFVLYFNWLHPLTSVILFLQLNQKLRESTEEEEPLRSQTCTDLQSVQDTVNTHTYTRMRIFHSAHVSHCFCCSSF